MKQRGGNYISLIFLILILIVIMVVLGFKNGVIKRLSQSPQANTSPLPITAVVTSSPKTSVNGRYGVNTGLMVAEDPFSQEAFRQAGRMGASWIRLSCSWYEVEPSDNQWNFSSCDQLVNMASSQGLNILLNFDPQLHNSWCTMSSTAAAVSGKPVCSDSQFQAYISQVVNRYKGKVEYYEVGNEPDLVPIWRTNPSGYAKALHLAYQATKQADSNAKVLIGGLASGGGQNSNRNFVLDLINDSNYPVLENFDIFNYHTYAKKENIAQIFDLIKANIKGKPIWITEVGYPSDPKQQQNYRNSYSYPSGENGQVAYMQDILPYLLNSGAEKVFWYTLVDVPRDDTQYCSYGILYIQGKQCVGKSAGRNTSGTLIPKKSFDAFRILTSEK